MKTFTVCFLLVLAAHARAQYIEVKDAPRLQMPSSVDSNSPAIWFRGELQVFNSTGDGPVFSRGRDQFSLGVPRDVEIARQQVDWPAWIESAWVDPNGSIIAWYHQEETYGCGNYRPAMPRIGQATSYDGGRTFFDQGIVLFSGNPKDCDSKNGYFAGGHGDFTVALDRSGTYFYFLFTNYAGPLENQGVVVARMAYADRFYPQGKVWKFHEGAWIQPGRGGWTTAIFPATVEWQRADADSFWGPSVHWNTYLGKYVMLLNRSCCEPWWPQEGVYASFNEDLNNPGGWSKPVKILSDAFWYPQVLGLGAGETDSIAGQRARLYVFGESMRELVFHKQAPGEGESPEIPEIEAGTEPLEPEEPDTEPEEPDTEPEEPDTEPEQLPEPEQEPLPELPQTRSKRVA